MRRNAGLDGLCDPVAPGRTRGKRQLVAVLLIVAIDGQSTWHAGALPVSETGTEIVAGPGATRRRTRMGEHAQGSNRYGLILRHFRQSRNASA